MAHLSSTSPEQIHDPTDIPYPFHLRPEYLGAMLIIDRREIAYGGVSNAHRRKIEKRAEVPCV